jgi:DNA-binding transcriptional regulator YiaG
MAGILPALNEHIRRMSRRATHSEIIRTRQLGARHRRDIAALKREHKSILSRLAQLEKRTPQAAVVVEGSDEDGGRRFRKDGLKTHRAKLGLSAQDYGKLVGVSALTIYHWEQGKSKPRRIFIPRLTMVRELGKREALRRLGA